jgi:hypothetical protein
MGAAGSGGAGLDVNEVFSIFLYTGTGSNRTITNGIDLSGEGGLVWSKIRPDSDKHMLIDTERGINKTIFSNDSGSQSTDSNTITAISTSGYTLGSNPYMNANNKTFVSWTWRKAPKFFDVVTYTGSGSAKTVAHSLGSAPGMIMIKKVSSSGSWVVYHRANTAAPETDYLVLNSTSATVDHVNYWNDTAPTDSVFTVGTESWVNTNGATYVAYIFAHNDGDGEFGPSGNQDIIKCGSYTGNGSNDGPEIDLGFEPQWLMVKAASSSGDWKLYDSMRGLNASGTSDYFLEPNTSDAEDLGNYYGVSPTGFKLTDNTSFHNGSGETYIYMAIRRGPLNPPEAATEVFKPAITYDENNDPGYNSGFVTDMLWYRHPGNQYVSNDEMRVVTRLTQSKVLRMDQAIGETGNTSSFDFSNGADAPVNEDYKGWLWKRAPGFFDVVARDGTNNSSDTIKHNLGAAPELIITKKRNASNEWYVGHDFGATSFKRSYLEQTTAASSHSYGSFFHVGKPTDTEYFLDGANANYNASGNTYIDFLFATLDGISKVGSVSHSGSSTNVDCGFSAGARFVMLKRTDATGGWYIWDSVRGIIAGNDPYLLLNTTAAEVTNTDLIDPLSSGFQISGAFTDGDYLFYAIA